LEYVRGFWPAVAVTALVAGTGQSVLAGPPHYARERAAMVGRIESTGVRDALLITAFHAVPRHEFVGAGDPARAYDEVRIPVGAGCAMQPPTILARALQRLNLTPKSRVLQVGSGSGYTTAVISEITGHLYIMDNRRRAVDNARLRVSALGYTAAVWKQGPGCRGWSEHAPYDAILVTCATDHVPQVLIDQLAEGGRLVIPIGRGPEQSLNCVEKLRGSTSEQCRLHTTVAIPRVVSRFSSMSCTSRRR
jgi:protein-L-isoaspartate(D-aspartate) O-methyltransferase